MAARSNSFFPVGVIFGTALLLSWTLMTAGVAAAMWRDQGESVVRLGAWLSLWTFTVLAPTMSAVTLHRSIARLSAGDEDPSLAELARLRPFLLLSANMALLSACALIFGRQ
jgi:hypothetical protein